MNPNYDAIGIGLVYEPNSTYKWYWAADFGGPGGAAKIVSPTTPQPESVSERASAAARASAPRPTGEGVDPGAAAPAARIAAIDRIALLIARLFDMLQHWPPSSQLLRLQ